MRKQVIKPEGVPVQGIYTPAFRVSGGDVLVCSGMTSADEHGNTVGVGDAGAQTRQILENFAKVLEAAGGSLDDVLLTRIFSTDMRNRDAINAVRLEFFDEPLPASTHIEVSRLAKPDRLLEIEIVAIIPTDRPS